jgi:hypothetical protein
MVEGRGREFRGFRLWLREVLGWLILLDYIFAYVFITLAVYGGLVGVIS